MKKLFIVDEAGKNLMEEEFYYILGEGANSVYQYMGCGSFENIYNEGEYLNILEKIDVDGEERFLVNPNYKVVFFDVGFVFEQGWLLFQEEDFDKVVKKYDGGSGVVEKEVLQPKSDGLSNALKRYVEFEVQQKQLYVVRADGYEIDGNYGFHEWAGFYEKFKKSFADLSNVLKVVKIEDYGSDDEYLKALGDYKNSGYTKYFEDVVKPYNEKMLASYKEKIRQEKACEEVLARFDEKKKK